MKNRHVGKRLGSLLLAGAFLLGTAGCGEAEGQGREEDKAPVITGEMVPVANYQEVKFDLSNLNHYEWRGDQLIYLESEWDKERNMSHGTLYQVNLDGTGAPEALYTGISEDHSLLYFVMGQDGSFLVLERKNEGGDTGTLYLRKLDADFQEIWLQEVEEEELQAATRTFGFFSDMYVDGEGNLLLTSYDDVGYFFDAEGRYTGCDSIQVSQGQVIDGGEQGMFYICQDWNGSLMNYQFQKLDFARGKVGDAENRDLSAVRKSGIENGTVLGGGSLGILISMENRLYSYDYDTGEIVELLDWQSLGVDGSTISEIRLLEEDFPLERLSGYTVDPVPSAEAGTVSEISPVLEAFSYQMFRSDAPEIVKIGHLDSGYVPERQTVTLGMAYMSTTRLGRLVRSFNRSNMEYEIEIKNYEDMEAFTEDLLFHPETVADMLELGWIEKDMLDKKGLLEDLKPYMKESDLVGEDDIMEVIRDACESNGKLTSMMAGFSVQTVFTTAESVSKSGWTYDQLFELDRDYPDSKLLDVYTSQSIWNLVNYTLDSYVDWEKGECHFDSPEFIRLLENIKGLSYPENQEDQRVFIGEEEDAKFLKQEFLLRYTTYYSPYDYSREYTKFKDKAWDVGFPTQEGELCYLLSPMMQFAIYSNSPNKDGAWAFLEFVLSEEEQSWYGSDYGGFPVRADAFETYLNKPYSAVYKMADDYTSEETIQMLREAMEHMRMGQSSANGQVSNIIYEETQAFYAGDKTVEQCVEIIQNRVQLYLDESF